jgi:phospholipid transport system transporter-binding protein
MPEPATAELHQESPGHLKLSGSISFQTSPDLLRRSSGYFSGVNTLEISMASVSRVDSSAVALMVEWYRQAKVEGVNMTFIELPEALLDLLRVFNLESRLPVRQ